MSIVTKNLTKTYGTQNAVDDVSFSVKSGEIVGFLGPNGAGKTTTMKILTSYIPSSAGEAYVCDFNVQTDADEVRKRIGYLPEHNPLYKDMYVTEYLNFVAGLHKIKGKKKRVGELIEITKLTEESHKKIGSLSKGYRQRVGLAQAMIHDPEVLILDEPTTGLDPNQLLEIRSLIKNLGKEKTVLFSSHIMQEVQALCDRVVIINKGKIVANDTIDVLTRLQDDEINLTVEFSDKVSDEKLLKIPGVNRITTKDFNLYHLSVSKSNDVRPSIFNFAVKEGIVLLEMKSEDRSIEDVFQKLTRQND